ncbi:hypothetical protein [Streptomyces sp. NRRL S-244]|uniref:hypothetical protein n=1 Tax=Streptomyces sp. NRRL S-244 TaxID=1463897 RepID=UPI0004BF7FA3|nr:hypothetical protein [Streptomyces sp. NRRL S-244]
MFVHGIGGPRDPAAEREILLRALADGARAAGHSRIVPGLLDGSLADVRFAYYGDLFTDGRARGRAGRSADEAEAELVGELLLDAVEQRLAVTADGQEARVLRRARAQLAPEGEQQGLGNVLRRVLNAANTLLALPGLSRAGGWISSAVMVHHLGQVRRYLARRDADGAGIGIDRRIRDRVAEQLDAAGPTIVIAHSLGTVVTFETLHDHTGPVPLFVTLGSPIGMRTAVRPRMRPQPLRAPATVGGWLNFWDRDDFIAGQPELEKWIAPNAAAVGPVSRRIDSDGAWAHPAVKYLSQPGVAGPVAEALVAAAAR